VDLSWLYFAMIFPLLTGMILRDAYQVRKSISINSNANDFILHQRHAFHLAPPDNAKKWNWSYAVFQTVWRQPYIWKNIQEQQAKYEKYWNISQQCQNRVGISDFLVKQCSGKPLKKSDD